MSYVTYNGVIMGLVRTKFAQQRPIMLGRNTPAFEVKNVWEVTLSQKTFGGVGFQIEPRAPLVQPVGGNVVDALVQLRDRLMVPRKALTIRVGQEYVTATTGVDAQCGPTPLNFTILGYNGQGSIVGEFSIQYAVRYPCREQSEEPPLAFLGHVWKVEDDLDAQFFMTRTYTGYIHLNPEVVGPFSTPATHPDVFRGLMLPPRTPEFHRVRIQVRQLEDGYTWTYKVTDQQPRAIVNSQVIADIKAEHEVTHEVPSQRDVLATQLEWIDLYAEAVKDAVGAGGAVVNASRERVANRDAGMGAGANIVSIVGNAIDRLKSSAHRAARFQTHAAMLDLTAVPVQTHRIIAEVFGKPQASYAELARAARIVCLYRFMRGGYFGTDVGLVPVLFGGSYRSRDGSPPKSSIGELVVRRRPPALIKDAGVNPRFIASVVAETQWAKGRNLMPVIAGPGRLNDTPIRAPLANGGRAEIPGSLRQLLYGGSILELSAAGGFDWGWQGTTFAPDLMSGNDGLVRDDQELVNGQRLSATLSPLSLALLAGGDAPCGYTTAAEMDVRVRKALPK